MQLAYLDFDYSEDPEGQGSFDAMASVDGSRLPALLAEVDTVLRWAHEHFGEPGSLDEHAAWDLELTASEELQRPLLADFDARAGRTRLQPGGEAGTAHTTLTLTLTGTPGFCEALRESFKLDD